MPTLPPTPPPAARRPSFLRVAAYAAFLIALGLVAWRGEEWFGNTSTATSTPTAAVPADTAQLLRQVREEVEQWPSLWNDPVFSSLQPFAGLAEATPGNARPFESRRSTSSGGRSQ